MTPQADPVSQEHVSRLLCESKQGNEQALSELMPLVYAELKRLANYYLRQDRPNHTLQPTALVHEAYLRLAGQRVGQWDTRTHFIRLAASQMRRVLVDYSRTHNAAKRGGKSEKIYLDERITRLTSRAADVVAVDEALTRLAEVDPEQARLVELRFFGGLSIEETAVALGVSTATVKRNWSVAKAWLAREISAHA